MNILQAAGPPRTSSDSMNPVECDSQKSITHAQQDNRAHDLLVEADPVELPLIAYNMIAHALPQSNLPTLRLVSKAWCVAASTAVQKLGKHFCLTIFQVERLPVMLKTFPCLSELGLQIAPEPLANSVLPSMSHISGLQKLALDCSVGQSPSGLQFILQQTKLTSLCLSAIFPHGCGIRDNALHSIGSILSLINLDLNLTSPTDDGISGLRLLTNLQSLRLPMSKYEKHGVTGRSLSFFAALSRLTHLSLDGWPIRDDDLVYMTCFASLQHLDLSDCMKLTCLCFMPLLQFPYLQKLEVIRTDEWLVDPIVAMFELLKPSVELHL